MFLGFWCWGGGVASVELGVACCAVLCYANYLVTGVQSGRVTKGKGVSSKGSPLKKEVVEDEDDGCVFADADDMEDMI